MAFVFISTFRKSVDNFRKTVGTFVDVHYLTCPNVRGKFTAGVRQIDIGGGQNQYACKKKEFDRF
jgi:hypothetical protein